MIWLCIGGIVIAVIGLACLPSQRGPSLHFVRYPRQRLGCLLVLLIGFGIIGFLIISGSGGFNIGF